MGSPVETPVDAKKPAVESVGVNVPSKPSLTMEEFQAWKEKKDQIAAEEAAAAAAKRKDDILSGRLPMNGRELWEHCPEVFDGN